MLLALQRFSRPRWPSCPRPGVSPPALQPRPGVSMPRAQCGSRGSALASACSPSSASAGLVEPASLAVAPSAGRLYASSAVWESWERARGVSCGLFRLFPAASALWESWECARGWGGEDPPTGTRNEGRQGRVMGRDEGGRVKDRVDEMERLEMK